VKGMYRQPISFFLKSNNDTEKKEMKSLEKRLLNLTTEEDLLNEHNLIVSDNQATSEYTVFIKDDAFFITRTEDIHQRPIVEQQLLEDYNAKMMTAKYMKAIAFYHFIKNINNPTTTLKGAKVGQPAAEIQIFKVHDKNDRDKDELLIPNKQQEIILEEGTAIVIKTINNTKMNKLYFALLKINDLFGIDAKLLGADVQEVFSNQIFEVKEGQAEVQNHKPYIKDFNFKATRHSYKLIASLYSFDSTKLKQKTLPPPKLNLKTTRPETTRKLVRRKPPVSTSWMAYNIDIVIENGDIEIRD
jgi:hypothetical protein